LAAAVADVVQENGPERLDLKQLRRQPPSGGDLP